MPESQPTNVPNSESLSVNPEGNYICDNCGEEIVVPIDLTQGNQQEYVEDCPVCCSPNVLVIEIDPDGNAFVRSHSEQDRY